jgi:hypothetical protein
LKTFHPFYLNFVIIISPFAFHRDRTGFQADELASLKASSFNLDSSPVTISADAAYSKRRREDVQLFACHLAELVRSWLTSRL